MWDKGEIDSYHWSWFILQPIVIQPINWRIIILLMWEKGWLNCNFWSLLILQPMVILPKWDKAGMNWYKDTLTMILYPDPSLSYSQLLCSWFLCSVNVKKRWNEKEYVFADQRMLTEAIACSHLQLPCFPHIHINSIKQGKNTNVRHKRGLKRSKISIQWYFSPDKTGLFVSNQMNPMIFQISRSSIFAWKSATVDRRCESIVSSDRSSYSNDVLLCIRSCSFFRFSFSPLVQLMLQESL